MAEKKTTAKKEKAESPKSTRVTCSMSAKVNIGNYQCFSPDTEILTRNGWKNIQNIIVGELVATLNPKNRNLEYKKVSDTHEYDYDGDLIVAYGRKSMSFSVTPNHNMIVSKNGDKKGNLYFVKAKNLTSYHFVPQWAYWDGYKPQNEYSFKKGLSGPTREYVFESKDWYEFMGWYLSEGCVSNPGWKVQICQDKEAGRRKIINLFERMGLKYYISKKYISFNHKNIAQYLAQFGNSHHKFIPREMLMANKEHLDILLESLMAGDGHWYQDELKKQSKFDCQQFKYKYGSYNSSSKRLLDDVMELGFKLGYKVSLGGKREGQGYVNLVYRDFDTTLPKIAGVKGANIRSVPYKGKIFCVTVLPYHTVLIRHRGRVSWSGQSIDVFISANDIEVEDQKRKDVQLQIVRDNVMDVMTVVKETIEPLVDKIKRYAEER